MNEENKQINEIFSDAPNDYDKKIVPTLPPEQSIGVDTNGEFFDTLIEAIAENTADVQKIESFQATAQTRDRMMTLIDTMCEDPIISAVVQTLSEDVTERNDQGRIVWVESEDSDALKYMNFLLDSLNVDKYVYRWANCLIKYGDVYLKLFRQSETEEDKFFKEKDNKTLNEQLIETSAQEKLDESVVFVANAKDDVLSGYVEMVNNPAEVFELNKFGKIQGYIKAPVTVSNSQYLVGNKDLYGAAINYSFNTDNKDIEVYEADAFVHGMLNANKGRVSESVELVKNTKSEDGKEFDVKQSYNVNNGESILLNTYRVWRELSLLETAIVLNRTTRSQLVRIIGVEVGDMPKEKVRNLLDRIKALMEQKSALDTNISMNEYTNPGPIENNVYVPTHGGVGNLSVNNLGGDIDVKGLADLEYFRDKLFGSLGIPKQYFGATGDSAGFDAGSSLAQISSRYAKKVKMVQNSLIDMITDLLNLITLSRGLPKYVNKFTVKMQTPATQEEATRQENINKKLDSINSIMGILGDVEDPLFKLKIITSLLSNAITNDDVINILNEAIESEEKNAQEEELAQEMGVGEEEEKQPSSMGRGPSSDNLGDLDRPDEMPRIEPNEAPEAGETPEAGEEPLPSAADLGLDLTDNNSPEV